MRVYLIVFVLTLLCQFIPAKDEKGYKIRLLFTFLPLFIYGAIRVNYGLDYETYEKIFYESHLWANYTDASEHAETGFLLLNRIVPTWRLFLIVTSALVCFAYGVIFYYCVPSKMTWLAIILLFLAGDKCIFFMFSGIRNAIAISMMMLAFPLIKNRKIVLYFLVAILAMQFHTSAIVFLPIAYFVGMNKQMTKREAVIWIVTMIILQFISLNVLSKQTSLFVDNYFDRYSTYAENAEQLGDTRTPLIRFAVAVFVCVIVWFMRTNKLDITENSICRLALLYSMTSLLGALKMRSAQYFGLFFVIGTVVMYSKWKPGIEKQAYLTFVLLYLGYAFFNVFMQGQYFSYQVYESIFD